MITAKLLTFALDRYLASVILRALSSTFCELLMQFYAIRDINKIILH